MKKISHYDKQRVSEVIDVPAFIIIYCDSPLPCPEAENGGCEGGHDIEIDTYQIDHSHTVSLLEQARRLVMQHGLK